MRSARRMRRLLAGVLAGVFALAIPTGPAFGEGSVNVSSGAPTELRHGLYQASTGGLGAGYYTVLRVYARAGETIQMGNSAMGLAGGTDNIRVYAPGTSFASSTDPTEPAPFPTDPVFDTETFDCNASDPGTGRIGSRVEELAGPLPNLGGYNPCEYVAPADGIYSVVMFPHDTAGNSSGLVGAPTVDSTQGIAIAIWDVTVRDTGAAALQGRVFGNSLALATTGITDAPPGDVSTFLYTRTGYEYRVHLQDHWGVNWKLAADDRGVITESTGQPLYGSARGFVTPNPYGAPLMTDPDRWLDSRHAVFLNRADPVAITGPGGLGEVRGFAATAIGPESEPFTVSATGSGGQSGATNQGSGATIAFSSPRAMEGTRYQLAIDTNRDGTFGNGADAVTSGTLNSAGNSFAWNGRDASGAVPACGDYRYQVRAALSEVHLTQSDVEASGGTTLERLSLPTNPSLPGAFALSYDDRGLTDSTPQAVTDGDSSVPGFHAFGTPWAGGANWAGDEDFIDQWVQLPVVDGIGTLRLLCADVQVVKSADPSPATAGEDLTFRLAVTNNGADTATAVVASDDLPGSVTFKSASAGCTEAASVVTCSLPSLAAGATHAFEIVVAVPSSATECIQNTGTVTNATPDPNMANNSSQICVPVVGRSGVVMTKGASSPTVATGGQVMYTLVIRNNGPSDDPRVRVTDPLPAGLTLVAAEASQGSCTTAANTVACDLGALKDEGSAQVLVTANVTATSGCITNVARVQGTRPDPDTDDNQASAQVCVPTIPPVLPPPTFDLAVDKRASVSRPVVGQRVTYRVVVRNNGPGAAPEAKLTDTYNNRATVVSVRTTQGTCTRELPITCELGRIESGASVTVTMVIVPLESGRQRNAASATSCCGTDRNPGNNIDPADVNVQKVPLRITKVASSSSVRAGSTINYRIRVSNPSKGTARSVRVCDRLPSGLSFVRSTPSARRSGSQRCWTISSLGAGKSRSFRVTARAARGASGNKVNRATVSSADVRPATARRPVRVVGGRAGVTG